jgi:hypothetical protein
VPLAGIKTSVALNSFQKQKKRRKVDKKSFLSGVSLPLLRKSSIKWQVKSNGQVRGSEIFLAS